MQPFIKAYNIDVIFNTVPSQIIDENIIGILKHGCLVIDLASGKGGVDFEAAKVHRIKAVHALALPGKTAPVTAGNALCDCVLETLYKEGVIAKK